jgi:hypothetical protein
VLVNLHLDLRASRPIAGAGSELREVFTNMILNAVDAMPAGGELWISSADEGEQVRVQVRDSGVGMDHETCARVFDPFFTTKEVKGTGLFPWPTASSSATAGGSTLSSPGAGTEFTLTFPTGAMPVEHGPSAEGPAPMALRALVADDRVPLTVLAEMLHGMGHQVSLGLGGPAAIDVPGARSTWCSPTWACPR